MGIIRKLPGLVVIDEDIPDAVDPTVASGLPTSADAAALSRRGLQPYGVAFVYSVGYTNSLPSEKRFFVVRKMLESKGYVLARISGSHHIFVKRGSLPVSIPVHGGKVKAFYVRKIEKIES